jgi:hypothetical protein
MIRIAALIVAAFLATAVVSAVGSSYTLGKGIDPRKLAL